MRERTSRHGRGAAVRVGSKRGALRSARCVVPAPCERALAPACAGGSGHLSTLARAHVPARLRPARLVRLCPRVCCTPLALVPEQERRTERADLRFVVISVVAARNILVYHVLAEDGKH